MTQKLTLDEVGVSEEDAAQVIYDLRRENEYFRRQITEIYVNAKKMLGFK